MIHMLKLGDLTTKIGSGSTPRGGSKVYETVGTAFVRSQNVLDWRMKHAEIVRITDSAAMELAGVAIARGDVLINITGDSIARCSVIDPLILPARVSQHVSILRPNELIESAYLMAALINPTTKARLLAESAGGTRNALTKAQLSALEIPVPPLAAQQRIVALLGALNEKIAGNSLVAGTADRLAALYTATSPTDCALSELATLDLRTVSPSHLGSEAVPHYSIPAFDNDQLPNLDSPSTIKSNKFLIDGPRVLVSKLNPRTPRVWAVDELTGLSGLASTELLPLAATKVSYRVLKAVLSRPEFARQLESQVAGTSGSHQRVRPQDLMAANVSDPRRLRPDVIDSIDNLVALATQVRRENITLAQLRDTLLPVLMLGRLRFRDAERKVEDAV